MQHEEFAAMAQSARETNFNGLLCNDWQDDAIAERDPSHQLPDDGTDENTMPQLTEFDRTVWQLMLTIRPVLRFLPLE